MAALLERTQDGCIFTLNVLESGRHSSIHDDGFPCDVAGVIRGQESNGACTLLRLTQPAHTVTYTVTYTPQADPTCTHTVTYTVTNSPQADPT